MVKLSTSRRRNRRLAIATTILTVVTVFLSGLVWQKWEQNCADVWVAAVIDLDLEVRVDVDRDATTSVGKLRDLLKMPVVQVFLWSEGEALALLRAPATGPANLQLHLNDEVSAATTALLTRRFPRAEVRKIGSQAFF